MTLIKSIAVLAVLLAAIAYFSIRARQLYRILRLGPTENRFDHIPERIRGVLSYVGLHTRMFRNVYSGTLHLFIFYGFVVLLTAIIQAFGEGIFPGFSLAPIGGATWIAFLQDLFGILVLVGVLMALVNRLIIRPRQFHESNEIDALIILGLIATIMIGMLGQNAARVAEGGDPSAAWRPVSSLIAHAFESFGWQGTAAIPAHEVFYWMHIFAVLAFLVYIPSSKHLHIIVAIPNVFFRKLSPKVGAQLAPIDLEHAEHYGVSAVTQWSWKNLLDLYSCTECGRCQEQCPAFLTGKPLNPKMIIVDARENLFKTVRDAPPEQRRAPQQSQKLIGEAIKEDEIWSCVACGACQQECPVLIEHVPKIIDMRRSLVLDESKFPKEAQGALRSIETQGNPYGLPRAQRMDWAQGLGVKTIEEKPDAEYLYFVGCAASYDEANRAVARAFVGLLQKAGIDFAILGRSETCNGDPARRIGNVSLPDPGPGQHRGDERRQGSESDRNLPALLQHHQERVPPVRRHLRGGPSHPAAGPPDQGGQAEAEQGDRRKIHVPRFLLPRPLERHLRPTPCGRRGHPGYAARRDRAPSQAWLLLRGGRRPHVDGGEDRDAHQPQPRRADAADPGAEGRDGVSVLSDDVPRWHLRQGRRSAAPSAGPRPVPGRCHGRDNLRISGVGAGLSNVTHADRAFVGTR